MYRVRSKWTGVVSILVVALLLLYGVLLFGEGGDRADQQSRTDRWIQSLREGLNLSSPASEDLGWELVLVNDRYTVPEGFPEDLTTLKNGKKVDSRIYPDLQAMFDSARQDGFSLEVRSGYRTKETQQQILDDKKAEFISEGYSRREAKKMARDWVAAPGHSEHELGLAVDINAEDTEQEDVLYHWLKENAWKYGFICRYPESKSAITHVEHEPWHYRYVGKEHAKAIRDRGYCLEEYIDELKGTLS